MSGKKKGSLLDDWHRFLRWNGKRKKKAAARRKIRAQALKDRNDAAKERDEARALRAAERDRHRDRVRAKRIQAAQRRQARIAAAGPVIRTVPIPVTVTPGGGSGRGQAQAQPSATQCGAPTLDGTACQNLVTDGKCSAGHIQRKRRPVTGKPLTEADRRFFARRDEGYAGPLDMEGHPVTRATEERYR